MNIESPEEETWMDVLLKLKKQADDMSSFGVFLKVSETEKYRNI